MSAVHHGLLSLPLKPIGILRNKKGVYMPKLKTKKGAQKRFKITGSGKVMRKKAFHGHILTKKSAKRKRNLVKQGFVNGEDAKSVKQMLPYK